VTVTTSGAAVRRALLATLAAALPARALPAQPRLFSSDDTLSVTLRTDLRALLRDRDTASAPWREATLAYTGPEGAVTVPLRVRTRGMYRLLHCDLPPIRLRFGDSASRGTLFHGLGRPKLVDPCRNSGEYEQYLLEEYAIYRVLRLLTPVSLSVRLLRVTYQDTAGRAATLTRYAFVTEDPDRFAARFGGTYLSLGMGLGRLNQFNVALLAVFQYFIGNTDWSLLGLHNVALLKVKDSTLALPYDFDWSGAINAPYARPAPILPIASVRERVYRGYCQPAEVVEPALARFEAVRDSIAAIYRSIPGLEPRSVRQTLAYFEEFYRAIANRPRFMRQLERDCLQ
jgi:hypothetical protein